jgi:hypothetical protein
VSARLRTRKAIAVLCIALVVFAAFVPAASNLVFVLTSFGFVVLAIGVTVIRREASRCDAQPVALVSLVLFRGPPAQPALA